METFNVLISRTGSILIEAESESDAMEKANNAKIEDISWHDDWSATDIIDNNDFWQDEYDDYEDDDEYNENNEDDENC